MIINDLTIEEQVFCVFLQHYFVINPVFQYIFLFFNTTKTMEM